MSTYSSIRDAIVTKVGAVSGISGVATVHPYERLLTNWTDYLAEFANAAGTGVHSWWVTLDPFGGIGPAQPHSMGNIARTYQFVVRGIMGIDDSANTETTFYDLVEGVMDALDAEKDWGVSAVIDYHTGPTTTRNLGWIKAGDVQCHYAEIVLLVTIEKAVNYA